VYDRAINDDHPAREMPGNLRANQEAELEEGHASVSSVSRVSLSPKSSACRVNYTLESLPFSCVRVVGGRSCMRKPRVRVHGVASSHGTCHLAPLWVLLGGAGHYDFPGTRCSLHSQSFRTQKRLLEKKGYPYARFADFVFLVVKLI